MINIRDITMPRKTAFPAALPAFSFSPMPRHFETSALTPTPVPIETATISICMGKARVSALSASSPYSAMLDTNALSTML